MTLDDHITPLVRHAVQLAWQGEGTVEPNPMVGALLVKEGEIIGQGYHRIFGGPHAEIEAIEDAKRNGKSPEGSVLVVTLEPCNHHGKTPPCTEAILHEKIDSVIFGEWDMNPKARGGAKALQKGGVKTLEWSIPETQELYRFYEHSIWESDRPYIHLKSACTPTGEITLAQGKGTTLSSPESFKYTHELRARYDGILVGRGTVETDNPKLTVRHVKGKNPVRIVLDSEQKLSPKAAVFNQPGKTLWITTQVRDPQAPIPKSTQVVLVKKNSKTKRVDLKDLMNKLVEYKLRKILVEGGETVNTELLRQGMVDELSLCITPVKTPRQLHQKEQKNLPKVFKNAFQIPLELQNAKIQIRGNDLWIEGKISQTPIL